MKNYKTRVSVNLEKQDRQDMQDMQDKNERVEFLRI